MRIQIVTGIGRAETELAAFDHALASCGVENLNLICLSSVIPKAFVERVERIEVDESQWGHKGYCVLSRTSSNVPGHPLAAGLGWVQAVSGLGLFVEHHGDSESEVESLCEQSLSHMCSYRYLEFGSVQTAIASATVENSWTCVLTIALYSVEGWSE